MRGACGMMNLGIKLPDPWQLRSPSIFGILIKSDINPVSPREIGIIDRLRSIVLEKELTGLLRRPIPKGGSLPF